MTLLARMNLLIGFFILRGFQGIDGFFLIVFRCWIGFLCGLLSVEGLVLDFAESYGLDLFIRFVIKFAVS